MFGRTSTVHFDKLGTLVAAGMAATLYVPFMVFSPNRIAMGKTVGVLAALPPLWGFTLLLALTSCVGISVLIRQPSWRFTSACFATFVLVLAVGQSGTSLMATASPYARVSPSTGFWILAFLLFILLTDALVRLQPKPRVRLIILGATLSVWGIILASGQLNALSILSEYDNRSETFWREGRHHIQLALGSLLLAASIGIPLGILTHRVQPLRAALLNTLSLLQTIPSMALFGILIAPLGWLAANVEVIHNLGIRGIGMAPAFVALFLYSLLPMVANTTAGLASIGADVTEAATGMGMTSRQRLFSVELPLALPVILTGIRIVLVQNIGLATIAALIGGGGFGVFVFQGLGQTATDLILLGALPTVALAFIASVFLNVMIDLSRQRSI